MGRQLKIDVVRYENPEEVGFIGYAETSDRSCILFFGPGGKFVFWADRDPETGAVIGDPVSRGDIPARIIALLAETV